MGGGDGCWRRARRLLQALGRASVVSSSKVRREVGFRSMDAGSGDREIGVIPRRRQTEEIEHRLGRLARKRIEAQVLFFFWNKEEPDT